MSSVAVWEKIFLSAPVQSQGSMYADWPHADNPIPGEPIPQDEKFGGGIPNGWPGRPKSEPMSFQKKIYFIESRLIFISTHTKLSIYLDHQIPRGAACNAVVACHKTLRV